MKDDGAISRRALLGGSAAIVASGALGVRSVGLTDLLHKAGLVSSPDHVATKQGPKPETVTFESAAMGRRVHYAMSTPAKAAGVLICLHGRNGNYRTAFDAVRMHDMVAEAGASIAVVGVDGGAASYWHKRSTGLDPQAMLHDELLPRIEATLGASLPKAVMGWSMGGYGALLAAQQHPDVYRAVVAASPALFRSAGETTRGAFDNAEDYRRNDVFANLDALKDLVVRVDCGTNDPFVGAARSFAAQLPHANPGSFSRGFHDAAYWRSIAPGQVRTIAEALGL